MRVQSAAPALRIHGRRALKLAPAHAVLTFLEMVFRIARGQACLARSARPKLLLSFRVAELDGRIASWDARRRHHISARARLSFLPFL
jgi:hypothetical protein